MTTTLTPSGLFQGMTCRFEEVDFEFLVYGDRVFPFELVETSDGSRHRREDCTEIHGYHYNSSRFVTDEQLTEEQDEGTIGWCDHNEQYYESDLLVTTDDGDTYHLNYVVEINGSYYYEYDDRIRHDVYGDSFIEGDESYCYVENEQEWYPDHRCHWCEASEEYHAGREHECEDCTPPRDSERTINRYHCSPRPDVYCGSSGFAVGFEIEKKSVGGFDEEGDEVDKLPLFSGWETDASCGVEGITHAYDPIDPDYRERFCRDLLDSEEYVNGPSDSTCGGHINISSRDFLPRELMQKFRKYAPLWYSIYRNRLNNSYCRNDKKIEHGGEKYSPVRTKSFGIEIRLPSRVQSATQLMRRFDLVGMTCRAMKDGWSFNAYIKSLRDLLLHGAYSGCRVKYANALRYARRFRIWMLDGIAHHTIADMVR